MALEFAHGAVQWLAADAVNTTYTISGLAFQPKALRFYYQGLGSATDLRSEATHSRRGVGFADGVGPTNKRSCVASQDQDAAGSMTCTSGYRRDAVAMLLTSTPAADGLLNLNAILADGFRLIVADQAPVDITIFWDAWGGTDITDAAVIEIAEPAATGNVDYVVPGPPESENWKPDVVMFAGVQATGAAPTAVRADSGLSVGFASGGAAADNVVVVGNNDDGSASADTDGYCKTGECLAMIALAGGNATSRATLTQFNADGFRLNWLARATTGRKSIALAIKGGSWKAGSFTIAAATFGATATVSGLASQPKGVSLIGRWSAEQAAGISATEDLLGLGSGSSPTSRRAQGHRSENATASAEIDLTIQYDQVLEEPSKAGGALGVLDIDAMLSDGFRIIVDSANPDGSATQWQGFLAFGDTPAPSADDLATKLLLLPDPWRPPGMLLISGG